MIKFNIYLRAFELDDYRNTVKWHNDDIIWSSVIGEKHFVSHTFEKKWVEENLYKKDSLKLAVCLSENDKHIGIVSLTEINWINRNAMCSWMIGEKSCWGNGYATEAVLQLLEFCFQERGLHRIYCKILESNKASQKVAMKSGFLEEGLLRDAVFKNGKFQNVVIMSILAKEYFQKNERN